MRNASLSGGVGWRALTCAGVCLNQVKRPLLARTAMMGQVDTTHTFYKVQSKQDGVGTLPMLLAGGR
jgi:hypothetical protein